MFSIKECIDRNDLIPVLSNVIFFVIVQTLFFKYVASKQYEVVKKAIQYSLLHYKPVQ